MAVQGPLAESRALVASGSFFFVSVVAIASVVYTVAWLTQHSVTLRFDYQEKPETNSAKYQEFESARKDNRRNVEKFKGSEYVEDSIRRTSGKLPITAQMKRIYCIKLPSVWRRNTRQDTKVLVWVLITARLESSLEERGNIETAQWIRSVHNCSPKMNSSISSSSEWN